MRRRRFLTWLGAGALAVATWWDDQGATIAAAGNKCAADLAACQAENATLQQQVADLQAANTSLQQQLDACLNPSPAPSPTPAAITYRVGAMYGLGAPVDYPATADAVNATMLRLFRGNATQADYIAAIRAEVGKGRMVHFAGDEPEANDPAWWTAMADGLADLAPMVHAVPFHEPGIENVFATVDEYRAAVNMVVSTIGSRIPVSPCVSSYSDRSGTLWVSDGLAAACKATGGAYDVDGYFRTLSSSGAYQPAGWGGLFDVSVARAVGWGMDVYITETGALSEYMLNGVRYVVSEPTQVQRITDAQPWLDANPSVKGMCWWPLNWNGTRSYRILDRPNSIAAWAGLHRA